MIPPFTGPDGAVFTFDHLRPIDADVSVTVNGMRYSIPVIVIFSNHCFTDGKNNTVQRSDELYILTDGTGHRAFCNERYRTSLYLPECITAMVEQNAACYKLDKASNYIHIHDPGRPNKWMGWYVFFSFDRSKAKVGEPATLRISVTSHHYRMKKPDNLRWTGSIKFPALVAEWLRNREDFLRQFAPLEDDAASDAVQPVAEMEKPA